MGNGAIPQMGNQEVLVGTVISEFDVKADERKRFTIRQAAFEHYHVMVFDDGHLELHPRLMVDATISRRALAGMDQAVANYCEGRVGEGLDVAALEALADRDD